MDAASWDERYRSSELVWSAGPNASVAEQLADLPPGRALDLAAGEGRNALWLAERGFEVEAIEFSAVALDKLRSLAEHRGVTVTCTLGDLTEDLGLAPADVVLIAYLQVPRAVEHDVVNRAAGLVAPGGTFLLVAHARRNLTEGVGGPPMADLLPTPEDIVSALAGTGLEIEQAGEVTREVEGGGDGDGEPGGDGDGESGGAAEPRTAIDVLVRARRPA